MSGLIGGEDGAYENFREFIDTENTPDSVVPEQIQTEELRRILTQLSEADRQLIQALFFDGLPSSTIRTSERSRGYDAGSNRSGAKGGAGYPGGC